MLNRVEPLRNELKELESSAATTRQKNEEVFKLIGELEKSIQRYKEEYAVLISQAQAIKADLAGVEAKVFWKIYRGPLSLLTGLHEMMLWNGWFVL